MTDRDDTTRADRGDRGPDAAARRVDAILTLIDSTLDEHDRQERIRRATARHSLLPKRGSTEARS